MRHNKHFPKSHIDYTNRNFSTIRQELENYARLHYPDTWQNFSDNSFESLMADMIAHVGDMLSFYIDYQANEMLLDNTSELENIRQIGKLHGYKFRGIPSAFGEQTFYAVVPASTIGEGPDRSYAPMLMNGTELASKDGSIYTLVEDVHFGDGKNLVVVSDVSNVTGLPTFYAIRARGKIVSGEKKRKEIAVGTFRKFPEISFSDAAFTNIISVFDSEGNRYYEVDNLSEDTIFVSVVNREKSEYEPQSVLRPMSVPRRFSVDFDGSRVTLQFGGASSVTANTSRKLLEPKNFLFKKHGKEYVSDLSFDPSRLLESDKLGVAPHDTTLFIEYRSNNQGTSNAAVGAVNRIIRPLVEFENRDVLNESIVYTIANSLETENQSPIVGETSEIDEQEIKQRIYGTFGTQKRAVTDRDYVSIIYSMPSEFGSIKKASVVADPRSNKRNVNIYVLSEDSEGKFLAANHTIKENLKMWLSRFKMVNDTVDILDAKVINLEIGFSVLSDQSFNKYDTLDRCIDVLSDFANVKNNIGDSFYITDVYKALKDVQGVLDVQNVRVRSKTGLFYSTVFFDVDANFSDDGRLIKCPKNAVFEVKFPRDDIRGTIK